MTTETAFAKVVMQPTHDGKGLVAHCDPATPLAWRSERILNLLRACSRAGFHANARAGSRLSKTEWAVPEEYIVRGENGKVDVHIPGIIGMQIGLRT